MGEAVDRPEVVTRRLVRVEWLDAAHVGAGDWVDARAPHTGTQVVTVGFVLRRTRRWLVLAQSLGPDNTATGVFVIPRINITCETTVR